MRVGLRGGRWRWETFGAPDLLKVSRPAVGLRNTDQPVF
jgi:hypothetical protein